MRCGSGKYLGNVAIGDPVLASYPRLVTTVRKSLCIFVSIQCIVGDLEIIWKRTGLLSLAGSLDTKERRSTEQVLSRCWAAIPRYGRPATLITSSTLNASCFVVFRKKA